MYIPAIFYRTNKGMVRVTIDYSNNVSNKKRSKSSCRICIEFGCLRNYKEKTANIIKKNPT